MALLWIQAQGFAPARQWCSLMQMHILHVTGVLLQDSTVSTLPARYVQEVKSFEYIVC